MGVFSLTAIAVTILLDMPSGKAFDGDDELLNAWRPYFQINLKAKNLPDSTNPIDYTNV